MDSDRLKTIKEFCVDNRISRASLYNVWAIDRGPTVLRIGGKILISETAEAEFRERLTTEPVTTGLRTAAEKLRRKTEVAGGKAASAPIAERKAEAL